MRNPGLDAGLFAFTWLTAAFAHADWLPPAARAGGMRPVSLRSWQRLSEALLAEHGLQHRHTPRLEQGRWVLWGPEPLHDAAMEVGSALLARRIRRAVLAAEVDQWNVVLGAERRLRALDHAQRWPLLARQPVPWSAGSGTRAHVHGLGASMLVAAVPPQAAGVAERFRLRFRPGTCVDMGCSEAVRAEVAGLLARARDQGVLPRHCEARPWH